MKQRAGVAFLFSHGGRRFAGGDHLVQPEGGGLGCGAERFVELDLGAPLPLAIEEGAGIDRDAQHLFEAQSLGTQLHAVAIVLLGAAAFVFDGCYAERECPSPTPLPAIGEGCRGGALGLESRCADADVIVAIGEGCRGGALGRLELDDIGLADQAELKRANPQPANDAHLSAPLVATMMRLPMQMPPFDGKAILRPLPFEMDQRTLPLAEQQVLQSTDRQELVFGVH